MRQLRRVVATEDYAAAVAFHRDGLGLPEREAIAGPDGAYVTILDAGRATVELANPAQRRFIDRVEVGREDVAPRLRLAFEVADARAVTAALVDAGAVEVALPTVTPWSSLNARLDAPAGLQITLFEELDATVRDVPDADPPPARQVPGVTRAGGDGGDWAAIWPFLRGIVAAGETFCWPRDLTEDRARALWMHGSPGRTVAAVDAGGTVLAPRRPIPTRAARPVANAGFMVDPAHAGRGVGRLATVLDAFDHPTHGSVGLHLMHRPL